MHTRTAEVLGRPATIRADHGPLQSLAVGVSLGELVPVSAGPITARDYQHACELATRAGREAARLQSTVGPGAEARGFDAWAEREGEAQAALTAGCGVLGAIAALVGGAIYGIDGTVGGAYAAGAGVAALSFSALMATASGRVTRALAKARARRVEAARIDTLLTPFARASSEVRVIAANAIGSELARIDSTLSAKAAEARDRALDLKPESPESRRAARLTVALAKLLREDNDEGAVHVAINEVLGCLTEASPAERREMGSAIERCAFEKEEPRFKGVEGLHEERRLYSAIRAAERGEAPTA